MPNEDTHCHIWRKPIHRPHTSFIFDFNNEHENPVGQ